MPGDHWQRLANLRLLFGYMWMHPGSKLLFMGGEFGQTTEWSIEKGIQWSLLDKPGHRGVQLWVQQLNKFYTAHPALYRKQFSHEGFEWIDLQDYKNSVLVFLRKGDKTDEQLIVALNFTPVPREGYHVGAPAGGVWTEVLNSDAAEWGGSGKYENGKAKAEKAPRHGRDYSLALTLPPLGCVVLLQKPAPRKTSAKAVPAAEKAAEPASPKPKTAKKKAG